MQRPREARQTQEGHNITPHEGQPHLGTPRGAETEAESSRARGHGPHLTPREEGNEATLEGHVGNEELNPPQQGMGERSWEQRFKGLQQELSRMKEVVKGRAPNSMDTLVQQTKSPFIVEVLHFPLPTKFRMLQIEVFGLMVPKILSITSTLIRIRWSYMGIRTLYGAKLSLSR